MKKLVKIVGGAIVTVALVILGPFLVTSAAQSASAPAIVKYAAQEVGLPQAEASHGGYCVWRYRIVYTVYFFGIKKNYYGWVQECGYHGPGL